VGAGELCRVSKESRSLTRAVGEPDILEFSECGGDKAPQTGLMFVSAQPEPRTDLKGNLLWDWLLDSRQRNVKAALDKESRVIFIFGGAYD
jgi:hypothetical protein